MYQKITLVGYLGTDPEMRYTPQGKAVTDFRMAISGYDDTTMWVKVTSWGDQAENCKEYLSKGSLVLVEGRMMYDKETGSPETYVSKKDGQTHASFEVTASLVKFLLTKQRGGEDEEESDYSSTRKAPWE